MTPRALESLFRRIGIRPQRTLADAKLVADIMRRRADPDTIVATPSPEIRTVATGQLAHVAARLSRRSSADTLYSPANGGCGIPSAKPAEEVVGIDGPTTLLERSPGTPETLLAQLLRPAV